MGSTRRFRWLAALLTVGALALVSLVGAYLWAMRQVIHAYYSAEYRPEWLDPAASPVPLRARVANVPALRTALERGPALAMQMLAAQQGTLASLTTIEFAMGTSWGALSVPRQFTFTPGGDEDVGFLVGAPLLGFTRRYLVTDDGARYLQALKQHLARGVAVRVVVDRPTLLRQPQVDAGSPGDLVLIGYDGDELEYYDPVCATPVPCEPGAPGAAGLKVPSAVLLEAVDRQALRFKYPWTYQLLVLEPRPPAAGKPTFGAALERNAQALIGTRQGERGPSTGSYAVGDLAGVVAKLGRDGFSSALEQACALAAALRVENAVAVRALFPGNAAVENGALKLELAAAAYERAHQAFKKKETFALTDALLAAAAADQEAGVALRDPR